MPVDVLLGLQWGDEGKGKIVDYLAPKYDVVARFQGGPNAGHTIYLKGRKIVLHTIPSGVFHEKLLNLIGNGVVIDPVTFKSEAEEMTEADIDLEKKLFISKKAHLILPSHRLLDAASEKAKGEARIGSTLRGIGPAYMDKTGRNGIRFGDIFCDDFKNKYEALKEKHLRLLQQYDFEFDLSKIENEWFEAIEFLKTFTAVDGEYWIQEKLKNGQNILAEGAQGSMLDVDFGTYPYVTSSSTLTHGACSGLGVNPHQIREVIGISKAYCTRVGGGPFPTELTDATGDLMRKEGNEYGATTGRPRRCGWLDLVALNYSILLNGVTQLMITKADVLNIFDIIKVGTAYKINGEVVTQLPFDMCDTKAEPVYEEWRGWKTNNSTNQSISPELTEFAKLIEKNTGVKVKLISVGPEREQLLIF
jgi:adenylosuccinate synthase